MFFLSGGSDALFAKFLLWLFSNYIEVLATLTGLIYLVYSVRGNIGLWFFGIITSALYVYVFFVAKIYADMSINVYYVLISIYGWYYWVLGKKRDQKELPVSRVNRKQSMYLLSITLVLFIFIAIILKKYTDSDIAVFDALTTSASITATWMLARKMLEHWLLWICIDALSIGLYIYKDLYPTVILFVFYTTLAVLGYFEWKRKWKEQENLVTGS